MATSANPHGFTFAASWWLRQWQASLPDALRSASGEKPLARLTVSLVEEDVELAYVDASGAKILCKRVPLADYTRSDLNHCLSKAGGLARRAVPISLVIPSAICGSLPIPARAQGQAETIIREHIARRTPLSVDQIYIGYALRSTKEHKFDLHYLVLPRGRLDCLLEQTGLTMAEVGTLESSRSDNGVAVTVPTVHRKNTAAWISRVALALPLLAFLAAVAAFGSLAYRQNVMLNDVEMRLARATASARQSAEELQNVYSIMEDLTRVAEMRVSPGLVQVWEELARILPDSTYLTEIEVREDDVVVAGFSNAAAGLIHLLETSHVLHSASFTGPLVSDRMRGKEQFSLRASLRKPRLPSQERD